MTRSGPVRRSAIVVIAAWILFPVCVSAGEVYRWEDEHGRIHYGDHPPADGATRMEIPKAPEADADMAHDRETQGKLLEVLEDDRTERENRESDSGAEAQARRANCDRVRRQLEKVRSAGYLFQPSGDPDNPRILSDEERAAATRTVEGEVQKWCGPSTAHQ